MPIIVKDYTWEQTNKMLFITVPLKGVKPQKVDLFSTEEYLKVLATAFSVIIAHILTRLAFKVQSNKLVVEVEKEAIGLPAIHQCVARPY